MKTVSMFLLLLVGSIHVGYCQKGFMAKKIAESEVPQSVKSSFSSDFPGVQVRKWEKHTKYAKQEKVRYVAVWNNSENLVNRARYKEDGNGISASVYYWFKNKDKLPQHIKAAATKLHPDYELTAGEKITGLKQNKLTGYRLRLTKSGEKLIIYVDEQGNAMSRDKVPNEIQEEEETSETND